MGSIPLGETEHHNVMLQAEDGGAMSFGLLIRSHSDIGAEEVWTHKPEEDNGQLYLQEHGLLDFGMHLMKAMAEEKPRDPYKFILQHLEAKVPYEEAPDNALRASSGLHRAVVA